jgi:arginine decarboxylase
MLDQTRAPILDYLQNALSDTRVPFYMPGHKRGQAIDSELLALLGKNLFHLDLPELPGLDSAIADAQELAAEAYGAKQTWFLVNGSTCGVQAMILAVCQPGEKILIGRNCHKAAIAALILSGVVPVYLPTEFNDQFQLDCGVAPTQLAAALRAHPDAKAVILVSPNYFGVVGEMEKLAELTHAHDLPLLVDAAHGAHLSFHPDLPIAALRAGADLVVQSTHKMATSLTQSAILHLQGDRIPASRVAQTLDLLQSSSPSLLLLASVDAARRQMAMHGRAMLDQTLAISHRGRSLLQKLPDLQICSALEIPSLDPTRLTVGVNGLGRTGFEVDRLMCEELGIVAELPTFSHLGFAISVGNTYKDLERLVKAFSEIRKSSKLFATLPIYPPFSQPIISPRTAYFAKFSTILLSAASDRLCQELICPYPPGIAILAPGERISSEAIAYLQAVQSAGGMITGASDPELQTIQVLDE